MPDNREDSDLGQETEQLSQRIYRFIKYAATEEYLTPLVIATSIMGGLPNQLTGYAATLRFTGNKALSEMAGIYSAAYNVVLYARSLRRSGIISFHELREKLQAFLRDMDFFSRGWRGKAEFAAVIALAVGMAFAALATAVITYNGLIAADKSTVHIITATIASVFCNIGPNMVSAGEALTMLVRPVNVGIVLERMRELADKMLLPPKTLRYRLDLTSNEALIDYLNQNVINVFNNPRLLQVSDASQDESVNDALDLLATTNASFMGLARRLEPSKDDGLRWYHLSWRYQLLGFIGFFAAIIAWLNMGSVKEGVGLFFSLLGFAVAILTELMTPFAELSRIILFVMSAISLRRALPILSKNLTHAFAIHWAFALIMSTTYMILAIGFPLSGTTFANAQLQDHPDWSGALAYFLALGSMIFSGCINAKNILSMAETFFTSLRNWWWNENRNDIPIKTQTRVAQIKAFESIHNIINKISSGSFNQLNVKDERGNVVKSVALVLNDLEDAWHERVVGDAKVEDSFSSDEMQPLRGMTSTNPSINESNYEDSSRPVTGSFSLTACLSSLFCCRSRQQVPTYVLNDDDYSMI